MVTSGASLPRLHHGVEWGGIHREGTISANPEEFGLGICPSRYCEDRVPGFKLVKISSDFKLRIRLMNGSQSTGDPVALVVPSCRSCYLPRIELIDRYPLSREGRKDTFALQLGVSRPICCPTARHLLFHIAN